MHNSYILEWIFITELTANFKVFKLVNTYFFTKKICLKNKCKGKKKQNKVNEAKTVEKTVVSFIGT